MRFTSVAAALALVLATCLPWRAPAMGDQPNTLTRVLENSKYLLLDSRIVAETENAKLSVGKIEKDPGNPLFREDKPWEVRYDNLYANVIFDRREQVYKCWYSPFIIDKATATATEATRKQMTYRQALAKIHQREMAVCYATSRDGIVWEKPELGIIEFDGSKKNNLVKRKVHGAGVFKDLRDPDPARRYKMFLERGGMSVCFSPDGLHWSKVVRCEEIKVAGDTHNNVLWDDRSGLYTGITRMWADGQRVVGRTTSPDFLRWTKAEVVFRGLERHLQTYAMPVFRYGNVYLGLVMIFNTQIDLVDCELAWSPDTVHWERVCPGTPLIPRGPKGSCDWGCVYGAAYPILHESRIRLYYGGSDGPHTDWRKGSLCLAWLRPDGFAAMEPAESGQTATIVTRPVKCVGTKLQVTADTGGGRLRVAVLDQEGFELKNCRPITTDVTDGVVAWSDGADLASLEGKPIRLKFELTAGQLYSFGFGR